MSVTANSPLSTPRPPRVGLRLVSGRGWHALPDDSVLGRVRRDVGAPFWACGPGPRHRRHYRAVFSLLPVCRDPSIRDGLHGAAPASPCPAPTCRPLAVCPAEWTGGRRAQRGRVPSGQCQEDAQRQSGRTARSVASVHRSRPGPAAVVPWGLTPMRSSPLLPNTLEVASLTRELTFLSLCHDWFSEL